MPHAGTFNNNVLTMAAGVADLAGVFTRGEALRSDPGSRELFHLDTLERGFYLARSGMVALSLELGDAEGAAFLAAVEEFLDARAPLLAA